MSHPPLSTPSDPEYAWQVATLFPVQGAWSEEAYLALTDSTNARIELVNGALEFLPMPTELHQALAEFLYHALREFVLPRNLGKVAFPPLRVRIRGRQFRVPDALYLRSENFHLRTKRYWNGADIVIEVVSSDPKDRARDYDEKLVDYAQRQIPEYWIVDPKQHTVTVHTLHDDRYIVHGQYVRGGLAESVVLEGFTVNVTELFAVEVDLPDE